MPVTRDQLPARDKWNLGDIYQSDALWSDEHTRVAERVKALSGYQGQLSDPARLLPALAEMFELNRLVTKLFSYARMHRDEDNTLTQYQALTDRAQTLSVSFGSACSFAAPELLALPEDYLRSLLGKSEFKDYHVYIRELIRQRPHTLSAAEEKIVAMAGELVAAPSTIYDMLTDADMRFPMIRGEDGELFQLTQSNYIPTMMSKNRTVRKAAYEAYFGVYKGFAATIPAAYAASVKGDLFAAQTGKFDSALEAALFPDDVPASVYSALIAAMRNHLPGLNKLVTLNARQNGLDKPSMYDVYVPVSLGFDLKLPFDEAYALVCDCLHPLGDDYVRVLRQAREERWIDPFSSPGKSSGAYSSGTYDTHPYVLMNYHEDLDSLLTIAHEMGHSMHTYYSDRTQPFPTSDYSIFVAEVASTVNEVLVMLELLDRHPEKEAQAYLLYTLLDGFRSTVFRQTMFAEFEQQAHALAESGEALTIDSLNEIYGRLNAAYYESVEQDDWIAHEWMRIPHFYRAFYVYKYATGFSAATAIAQRIRQEGAPAVSAYRKFLSAGASVSPIEALKLAGIDMSTGAPVEQALGLFEKLLARYENALK